MPLYRMTKLLILFDGNVFQCNLSTAFVTILFWDNAKKKKHRLVAFACPTIPLYKGNDSFVLQPRLTLCSLFSLFSYICHQQAQATL